MAANSVDHPIDNQLGSYLLGQKCVLFVCGTTNSRFHRCWNILIWSTVFDWNIWLQVWNNLQFDTINFCQRLWTQIFRTIFPFRVRGALSASLLLASNFGIVIAFAIGTYHSFHSTHSTALFAMTVNALFVALFLVFPETPIFLLKNNRFRVCSQLIQSTKYFEIIETFSFVAGCGKVDLILFEYWRYWWS